MSTLISAKGQEDALEFAIARWAETGGRKGRNEFRKGAAAALAGVPMTFHERLDALAGVPIVGGVAWALSGVAQTVAASNVSQAGPLFEAFVAQTKIVSDLDEETLAAFGAAFPNISDDERPELYLAAIEVLSNDPRAIVKALGESPARVATVGNQIGGLD